MLSVYCVKCLNFIPNNNEFSNRDCLSAATTERNSCGRIACLLEVRGHLSIYLSIYLPTVIWTVGPSRRLA